MRTSHQLESSESNLWRNKHGALEVDGPVALREVERTTPI